MANLDDWIGKEERQSDRVTASALARFRATIGSGTEPTVPPGFHWCLCTPDAPMDALAEDGHPRLGGFLPPVPLPRRMWAASTIDFLSPIDPEAAVERLSTVASIVEKTGRSGSLFFVEVDHVIRSDDEDAVRERQTLVYREASDAAIPLPHETEVDLSAWPATRTIVPDAALLFRYSALTFNTHRIHYDLAYARDVEGYPGLVVHGPLMATLLLDLAAREIGADAIGRFAMRAVAPAFASQPLHVAAREEDDGLVLAAIRCDGETAMKAQAFREAD